MNCRHCNAPLRHTFLDLGFAPPSNAYLTTDGLRRSEKYYPLRVQVCCECWLVQIEDYAQADELFSADYAYFSSTSSSWLAHARAYCEQMRDWMALGPHSHVVEVASNDGYLLRNFVQWGVPCLGIEPTASTAAAAEALGVPVLREFFGEALGQRLAAEGRSADLIVGNNVYAHVPDINDFTRGLAAILSPEGVVTLEFPHLMRLIEHAQFDTVYHEHFSYLSLGVVRRVFAAAGLRVWDAEELPTHGGSLRVYGCLVGAARATTTRVAGLLQREEAAGLTQLSTYTTFQARADKIKNDLIAWLIEQKRVGRRVAAYGAAAKGNTLLNYAGVKPDLLPYVVDRSLGKVGKFMPGSGIAIVTEEHLKMHRPELILLLPWNLREELIVELGYTAQWGAQFVIAVPRLECFGAGSSHA